MNGFRGRFESIGGASYWELRAPNHGFGDQAELSIPWSSLAFETPPPEAWRANFFRIERHRGEPPEFSAWSPTGAVPADFHKPASFGLLVTA